MTKTNEYNIREKVWFITSLDDLTVHSGNISNINISQGEITYDIESIYRTMKEFEMAGSKNELIAKVCETLQKQLDK